MFLMMHAYLHHVYNPLGMSEKKIILKITNQFTYSSIYQTKKWAFVMFVLMS